MRERAIDGQWHVLSECITCGVTYSVPKALWDHQRQTGGYHHCCNGHSQGWDKDGTENAKLRRERDRLQQQIAQKDDEIREQERRRVVAERKTARTLKRAHAGVCPCCNRTFQDVVRHMKHKHPEVSVLTPAINPRPQKETA